MEALRCVKSNKYCETIEIQSNERSTEGLDMGGILCVHKKKFLDQCPVGFSKINGGSWLNKSEATIWNSGGKSTQKNISEDFWGRGCFLWISGKLIFN